MIASRFGSSAVEVYNLLSGAANPVKLTPHETVASLPIAWHSWMHCEVGYHKQAAEGTAQRSLGCGVCPTRWGSRKATNEHVEERHEKPYDDSKAYSVRRPCSLYILEGEEKDSQRRN